MFKPNRLNLIVAAALGVAASPVLAVDTGDAPQTYGDASHDVVIGSPQLGEVAPDNNGPIFGPFADGDDLSEALDDEDGVVAFPTLVQYGKAYTTNVFLQNNTGNEATLAGWIDFDGNGVFDPDEYTVASVQSSDPGEQVRIKLEWNSLTGVTSEFFGPTFARFRISSQPISAGEATGFLPDGEVEDYLLQIEADFDGDEIPDTVDPDNDNDGIPDAVEGNVDTDGDTTPDSRDFDSDNDGIGDFIEAGDQPTNPVDTDGDGTPDYLDLDSNNDGILDSEFAADDSDQDGIPDATDGAIDTDGDGILNSDDIDSDNDGIPDAIEFGDGPDAADTDGDGIADFLDLDSDNDGIPDAYEANFFTVPVGELDFDPLDGRLDANLVYGTNGYADVLETDDDSGIPVFAVSDVDNDGVQDFRDLDSDADGINDVSEAGGNDVNADGIIDNGEDANDDGLFDGSINFLFADGQLPDVDEDFVPDFQDTSADGSQLGTVGSPTTPPTPTEEQEPLPPTDTTPPAGDSDPIIQTGLNGVAGCSVSGKGKDGVLPMLALISFILMAVRRRKMPPVKS